jgi:hypothetical protein
MDKKTRKWASMALISTLAVTLAAGCSNNGNSSTATPSPEASNNEGSAESMWSVPVENGKYTEPVQISQLKITPADVKYAPGENENENHFTKWLAKTFKFRIRGRQRSKTRLIPSLA